MTANIYPLNVIGITGWSGSGKTSLIIRLIPELRARGMRVATLKHAHHSFDLDTEGKDSYRHRAAGASEVVVSSRKRWAIMHENSTDDEPSLDILLARMSPADIILVEGFKGEGHAKIEVHRPSKGAEFICGKNENIVAIASDEPLPAAMLPVLDLNDTKAVADFIMDRCAPALAAARTN